ncbi:sensor protein CutS [Streptomyces inusitatus]|uniref:histidine kinase n=1 Tax=Streptomyces inusitatus TaxID=68221 RepID=A0A918PMP3_9ACTN|nr:HAMP domain-containing sensor histidine kinase [Streptomyces inusitatus]GGZ15025.1 sensor protein CutS [Streptomyces inusitatus]
MFRALPKPRSLPNARLRPSRVRTRLTLLYGALFTLSGIVLLGILFLLVSQSPKSVFHEIKRGPGPAVTVDPGPGPASGPLTDLGKEMREQADRQRHAELRNLLVHSGIALAIMTLISLALGWLLANRVLRPLSTMNTTIQRISARNLHERLAAEGPPDEMKALSDTVDGLLERLETALAAHKRFVANAAHELRTPLTLEHALIEEMLIDREAGRDELRKTFQRVLEICQQQGRLLESLLTLTTGERGLDRREPLDLSELTGQVLDAARAELDVRGLSLATRIGPAPAAVLGDPALVERLIANLLDNATDYNVPGGSVEIECGVREGRAVVSVVNTGREVPAEQLERLFEPFHRLDRTAGRDGHHGLGLSIVRAIALAHDASLAVSARPGGGLSVQVSFPVPADPVPAEPGRQPERPALNRT